MDATEKNITSDDAKEQNDEGTKTKGKRLRIKDTRKVDYIGMTNTDCPYQPTYGQTRQSSSYPQRSYSQQDGDNELCQQRTSDNYQDDNRYNADSGTGYQRRSYRPQEQGGYQQRGFGGQSEGYQQYRTYDNSQDGGYQQRRSYDNIQGGGYKQRRSYDNNADSGYQQRKSYSNQSEGRQGGYQQRSYNQGGGYQQGGYNKGDGYQHGGYNKGGSYNQGGGYHQNTDRNQRGGYDKSGGYNQGGFQNRKPMGGSNMRKLAPNRRPFFAKQNFPRPIKYKEVVADVSAPIRLNKYLANAGVCSRREADDFIQTGAIKVNGEVITELGTKITRLDKVTFNDQSVQIESKIYILLNKPKNCVTTFDDPQNRQTVMGLVKNACQERIYPVGRLDRNTTGVLLLTNDGEMAAKLTHPSYKKKKIYHVWLDREITIGDMEKLANGIELEGEEIHADAISYANEGDKSQVGIEIHSGKNRIVRRMFETLDYHVIRLDRVYFAGLTKRNLGRGKWRYLSEQEVNALRIGAYD